MTQSSSTTDTATTDTVQDLTQAIPETPRHVPMRTAIRAHWVSGVLALALIPIIIPLVIVISLAGGDILPLHDDALDQDAAKVPGRISAIDESSVHDGGGSYQTVSYEFVDHQGANHQGSSLVHADAIPETVTIEYLPGNPAISRIQGTRRRTAAMALDFVFGLIVLPGILCLLYWLRGVLAIRTLLGNGLVAVATISDRKPVFGINPPQWRVRYQFLTQTGERIDGSHPVGKLSVLGKTIAESDRCAVIYDDRDPKRSRLVIPGSFTIR